MEQDTAAMHKNLLEESFLADLEDFQKATGQSILAVDLECVQHEGAPCNKVVKVNIKLSDE